MALVALGGLSVGVGFGWGWARGGLGGVVVALAIKGLLKEPIPLADVDLHPLFLLRGVASFHSLDQYRAVSSRLGSGEEKQNKNL